MASSGAGKPRLDPNEQVYVVALSIGSRWGPETMQTTAGTSKAIAALKSKGRHVVLVASGALRVGCDLLGCAGQLEMRPPERLAMAAVGQTHLLKCWEDSLRARGLVLLTQCTATDRRQYYTAVDTVQELLLRGIVPIICDNDTIAATQLRFRDNDVLAAQAAALVQADWLFFLTDTECLYASDPKAAPAAPPQPIRVVADIAKLIADSAGGGIQPDTPELYGKLPAARIATAAGVTTVLCSSAAPQAMLRIADGEEGIGTRFPAASTRVGSKQWLMAMAPRGQLWLAPPTVRALRDLGDPLYAAGVLRVIGHFAEQDCVSLCDADGHEIGRGIALFGHQDLAIAVAPQAGTPQRRSSASTTLSWLSDGDAGAGGSSDPFDLSKDLMLTLKEVVDRDTIVLI